MSYRNNVLVLLSIIWIYLFVTVQCQLCEENTPSYIYSSITVICNNISEKFPPFVKPVSVMKCINCNIPVLDENTITNFKGETFNLSYSHVRNLSLTAFKSLVSPSTSHRFLFQNNDINYVAPMLFSNLPAVDEVNLKFNNLSTLEDRVFYNTSTSALDLSNNHLGKIGNTFAGLRVTKLNLSSNEIEGIGQNDFDDTIFWPGRQWRISIQQLDLSNNLIEEIHPNTFKSPSSDNSLRSLFLNKNRLTIIQNNTFDQLGYLRFLTLEENYISELYMDSFKGLLTLNTLVLKNNNIAKIPASMFADLKHLEFLDMSLNHLTALTDTTFSGLPYLTKLNISHNNLRILDESHILPLGRLMSLDITDTALKEINLGNILEHHYKLRVLVLNDNFWTCKDLVKMYKLMNERIGGFDYPAHHYDVPNLHGIACSRVQLDSYDDMTFAEFLSVISQDTVFQDLFDSRLKNEYADLEVEDIFSTIKHVRGIYYMMLIITIIVSILFVRFVILSICQYLSWRNILTDNKYSFKYAPNQDNVVLI